MILSDDLISQFVKVTKDTKKTQIETTVYGTIVEYEGFTYAKLDGSDRLTPVSTTVNLKPGDRVTVLIKNHEATVTGSTSSPSARGESVEQLDGRVTQIGILLADKASIEELNAEIARIDSLTADNATIKEKLTANEAFISELQVTNVTITGKLEANEASIKSLQTSKLDAEIADITYATIANLNAVKGDFNSLESTFADFKILTTDKLTANEASIKDLQANKLSATDIEGKYANIDFSNIGKAAMEYFYANSGLIQNVVIGDATISGSLVGVTISGDLIEGSTIVADKLVIKGDDGLYYKLNTDGIKVEAEQTDYNSLNGQVIRAKSVTAEKISVSDLVAFGATIGGINITDGSLYSGVKESVNNTTRGFYVDKEGQLALGDASNFIKYYKDQNGNYKLAVSASNITFGTSSKNVEEAFEEVQSDVDNLRDEITTLLRIESSRGTVFKNDNVATVLSVVIYHGTQRITDSEAMKSVFGSSAYLQWKWQRLDDDSYGVISSSDSRFGDNGFTFTLSPGDVDTKVTFMCELITQ